MGLHFCWLSDAHPALLRLVGPDIADVLFHARLGVESFLVLAGFMVAHMLRPVPGEDVRFGAYFVRRACRLLLPFSVAVLCSAADKWLAYVVFGGGRERPGLAELASQLLLVNEYVGVPEPAVGYWTLATLEQFYLGWLAALVLIRWGTFGETAVADHRAAARMGLIAACMFFASGAAFLGAGPVAVHFPRYTFYIAFGILLYDYRRLGLHRGLFPATVLAMVTAAVWLQHSRLTAALVAAGVLYALAGGARFPNSRAVRVLRIVGQRAYSVYLVHAVLGIRVLSAARFVVPYGDWLVIPLVVAATGVSLAGAFAFYRLVEQPCQALARRVRYRATVSAAGDQTEPTTPATATR
jgi:peptidoglycan/LPS O-acetylase OafA/YrhL